MCNIAGYVGARRAAPILIEMLKRQEFYDGGMATGIATIHEGKLYFRKVLGDVETLLRETDALELPGTIGIIHSRPGGGYLHFGHPHIPRASAWPPCITAAAAFPPRSACAEEIYATDSSREGIASSLP